MKITDKGSFLKSKNFYIKEMLLGKIFIYPTDTIYGIGCNALNSLSVKKIQEAKQRNKKPFSVIAPSKKWIKNNCIIGDDYLLKLPGKITLILNLRNKNCVSREINQDTDNLGVRIPDNWFSKIIEEANIPFVTTSVNITGEQYIKSIKEIPASVKKEVDYAVDDGILNNNPSTIIDLSSENIKVTKR